MARNARDYRNAIGWLMLINAGACLLYTFGTMRVDGVTVLAALCVVTAGWARGMFTREFWLGLDKDRPGR